MVKFASAHIDGVESEIVVPYPHSMQAMPEVVAEVERILHQHVRLNPCQEPHADRWPLDQARAVHPCSGVFGRLTPAGGRFFQRGRGGARD